MAGLQRKDGLTKYLVLRVDGTRPSWPWFVLGAPDVWAPAGLRAYADAALEGGADLEYVNDIRQMADEWERYTEEHAHGDPDAPRHRTPIDWVLAAMTAEPKNGQDVRIE